MATTSDQLSWGERARRALRHHWFDEKRVQRMLPPEVQARIGQSIAAQERHHSAELRVCIEGSLPPSYVWRPTSTSALVRERALSMFGKLRVWDTEQNNGVLLYLQLAEHAIEIVADRGFNQRVSQHEWQAIISEMSTSLKSSKESTQIEAAIRQGLGQISRLLHREYPWSGSTPNANELPDAPHVR